MSNETTSVAINDWVSSESPGIWRIYRIIENVKRFRFGINERQKVNKQRLIFSKRLANESWRPALGNELSTDTFVHALSDGDKQRLEEWITKNPEAMRQFEAFKPASIDLRVNLSLHIPTTVGKENVQHLIRDVFAGVEKGMTNDAILQRIAASELARYAPKTMSNATLQFVCKDHELRDNEYVFREVQLLMA